MGLNINDRGGPQKATFAKFCKTGMSEYVEKGPNEYSNIFEKLKPHRTNMGIYSKDWNLHKQIFECIWGQSFNEYSNIFRAQSKKRGKYALKIWHFGKNWREKNRKNIFANIFWS